jgi:hypothetical protein
VGVLSIYGLSILCSVPFMVPPTTIGWPVGSLAGWFGGADFSYYVSFFVAGLLYFLYRERTAGWWFNGSQTVSESAKEG